MNNKIYASVLALLLLALAGCSAKEKAGDTLFHLDKAAWVVLNGGDTYPGLNVELKDPAVLGELRNMLCAPHYEKDKPSKDYVGCGYHLQWFDGKGEPLEAVEVNADDYINYKDYFWNVTRGVIGTAYLEGLLEEAHPLYRVLAPATKLCIVEGPSGEELEVQDPATVDALKDLLGRARLEKGDAVGCGFCDAGCALIWYDENGEEVCVIPHAGDSQVSYGGWYWDVVESPAGPVQKAIEMVFDQELGPYVLPAGSEMIGDGFIEHNGIDCAWISTPDKEVVTQDGGHIYNSVRAFGGVRAREIGPASQEDYENYAYKVAWGKEGQDYAGICMEVIIREDGALVYDGAVHEPASWYNHKYVVTQYFDKALEDTTI